MFTGVKLQHSLSACHKILRQFQTAVNTCEHEQSLPQPDITLFV